METKITSINFVDAASVPRVTQRETANAKMVATILDNLKKAPAGKHLLLDVEGLKGSTRYALQKALQKHGEKVVLMGGANPANGRPCLFVKRLTDKEFAEWQGMAPAVGKKK
jgi:hypothetical protein